jgi:ferredoxin-NADP reductase
MSHQKFNLILGAREFITPRVMKFSLAREDGAKFEYTPGQFITLHLPWQDMVLRRSYSIATPARQAGEAGEIEIAVTAVEGGRATDVMSNLRPGARIEATGPFGRFVLRDDPPVRYVLVATGTGVSPYRSMLPALSETLAAPGYSVDLLLGVRSREELLFGPDFEQFAERHSGFRFSPSFSRRPDDGAHHGYVQQKLAQMPLDPEKDIVYLCGNPDMIDEAVAHLKALGFNNPHIRREKYVSSN